MIEYLRCLHGSELHLMCDVKVKQGGQQLETRNALPLNLQLLRQYVIAQECLAATEAGGDV
ncbi:hypothetical protein E2C01_068055 [Portunus trituberculatus]|uniref:Uncharacterized protein n=1 Tax=Portunus trituberculatus TaxID=210409 RepID=A0A5B7HYG2_PORTR|nr:hypothetical protein [Portunus trituberculatus]